MNQSTHAQVEISQKPPPQPVLESSFQFMYRLSPRQTQHIATQFQNVLRQLTFNLKGLMIWHLMCTLRLAKRLDLPVKSLSYLPTLRSSTLKCLLSLKITLYNSRHQLMSPNLIWTLVELRSLNSVTVWSKLLNLFSTL